MASTGARHATRAPLTTPRKHTWSRACEIASARRSLTFTTEE